MLRLSYSGQVGAKTKIDSAVLRAGAYAVYAFLFAMNSDGVQWPPMQFDIMAEGIYLAMVAAAASR